MKVLLIDVYHYAKGGAETVCFNTGNLLKEKGHSVCYFTLKWENNLPSPFEKYFPESKETRKGFFAPIKNLVNYFYHFEAAQKMEQLIVAEKPDIAHIHLMWGQITPSIFPILKKHNVPVVFSVHDYRIVCPAYTFRDGRGEVCEDCKGSEFYKCFTHICTKGSRLKSAVMAAEVYFRNHFFNPSEYIDGFLYVSDFAKQKQEQYMRETKDIPNVVLHNFSNSIVSSHKQKGEKPYFLFFGRLSYEKGVKTLIDSFGKHPNLILKIVGTGPLDGDLHNFVKKNGYDNVSFLGYRTGDELKSIVADAYFVIVPSEWYENNPMTIIESYSVATPVIGARIGGIPEIVQDGETGFLFNSGEVNDLSSAIEKANSLTSCEYEKFSKNVLSFANANFEVERYYENLKSFYEIVLRRKRTIEYD